MHCPRIAPATKATIYLWLPASKRSLLREMVKEAIRLERHPGGGLVVLLPGGGKAGPYDDAWAAYCALDFAEKDPGTIVELGDGVDSAVLELGRAQATALKRTPA